MNSGKLFQVRWFTACAEVAARRFTCIATGLPWKGTSRKARSVSVATRLVGWATRQARSAQSGQRRRAPARTRNGGLTEARRVAALAHAHGLPLPPHVWGSALLWAASLQLAAATPNCVIFEFCQAYYPLLYDLLTTPVAVDTDGYVSVPAGPGLGVALQPEADLLRKYPFEGGERYAEAREAVRV